MSLLSFFKGMVSHPQAPNLYHYKSGPNFGNPGAGAFVFNAEFSDPTMLFRGSARLAGALSIFQGHVMTAQQLVPMRGFGGTQAGQITFQGLSQANAIADAQAAIASAQSKAAQ